MINKKELQKMYDMELHIAKRIHKHISLMRVPGGWIYEIVNSDSPDNIKNVFVPIPAQGRE